MMSGKEIKRLVNLIPDDAFVTIDGNPRVDVTSVAIETSFDGISADLQLTPGWSISNDRILSEIMADVKKRCANHIEK